jgi:hypothetical protein
MSDEQREFIARFLCFCWLKHEEDEGSLPLCIAFEGGVQHSAAVIFLLVFGQPVATRRRTRLEGVLAVLGEIRGGGPVWDVESGGTICVLVADCQRPQSRVGLKPETITATFEELSPAHEFFDYTTSHTRPA